MKRFVADTHVLISALGWLGYELELVKKAATKEIQLCTSPELLREFKEVATRQKFGFTANEIDEFLEALLKTSTLVFVNPKSRVSIVAEDPSDDRVIECAVAAKVDFIASGDKHLLKLKEFHGIKILRAKDALRLLRKSG